jgi:mRNA interferase MazF
MPTPRRGEVWLIDFGFAGKTRPALVVSVAFGDLDRALITVVPHTTTLRGSPWEIAVPVPFLKPGAFLVQGVTAFPTVKALHRLAHCKYNRSKRSLVDCCIGWDIPRSNHQARHSRK